MPDVRMNTEAITAVTNGPGVVEKLRSIAEQIASAAEPDVPAHLELTTRAGHGRRGAFAQVQMAGSGALAVEFGSRNNAPIAPLRRALHQKF